MALKTDKPDNPANVKVADCIKQESTKKTKTVRKKYSSNKTEFQVRKRRCVKPSTEKTICDNTHQFNFKSQSAQSVATMLYPPCPQYYPITTNEWSPVIPIQCPMYSLQPIPVIVNSPLLSTQICPYPPIAVQVTVANEYPVSHLVSASEFTQRVTEVSPIELSPGYCDASPLVSNLSNGFSNGYSSFTQLSNKAPSAISKPDEFSPLLTCASYEFSPIGTPMSDVFSPIQTIQVPSDFIPICNTVCNEISPLSSCSYETCLYNFECDLPIFDENHTAVQKYDHNLENPLEFYISLPKDLFPTARMMTIDPNSIIDAFCRVPNIDDHSWILDLEFGVPKTPVSRRVATYNVKLNSINCKNVPEAIHPGFESCDKDLKRALMFYYDCVISNWYTGYIALSSDRSVENFQSWLMLPMQVLGMCWP